MSSSLGNDLQLYMHIEGLNPFRVSGLFQLEVLSSSSTPNVEGCARYCGSWFLVFIFMVVRTFPLPQGGQAASDLLCLRLARYMRCSTFSAYWKLLGCTSPCFSAAQAIETLMTQSKTRVRFFFFWEEVVELNGEILKVSGALYVFLTFYSVLVLTKYQMSLWRISEQHWKCLHRPRLLLMCHQMKQTVMVKFFSALYWREFGVGQLSTGVDLEQNFLQSHCKNFGTQKIKTEVANCTQKFLNFQQPEVNFQLKIRKP